MLLKDTSADAGAASWDFGVLLGKFGAVQLDMLVALRDALAVRDIGPDFLRWACTADGKAALCEAMEQLAYTYRISLAGASGILQFSAHPGIVPMSAVPGSDPALPPAEWRFLHCMLRDRGVEMTDRFAAHFPTHAIPARDAVGVSPYLLSCASPDRDIIRACGTRRYADCHMLMQLLDWAPAQQTPLLTTRANLFLMPDVKGALCIVELWNHQGWRLDAFAEGERRELFEPGCRLFVPVGVRSKADESA